MNSEHSADIRELFDHLMQADFTWRAKGNDALTLHANQLATWLEQEMPGKPGDTASMAVSSASEEMSANLTQVSERITQISVGISQANQQSGDAASAVAHASEAISNITQRVGNASKRVQALSTASDEIGGILTAIKKISDQTNLLALNATIEAARAGDAGRGFAVVADEVKQLSLQTKQATEEIGEKVQYIQQNVHGLAEATEEITGAVDQGDRDINTVEGRIDEVRGTINIIASEMDQVTQATQN